MPREVTISLPDEVEGHRVRVGCDVLAVQEVADSLATFGDRYLRKVFTAGEINDCQGPTQVEKLAARFAAKEAVIKAFAEPDMPYSLREIEVTRAAFGQPETGEQIERYPDEKPQVISLRLDESPKDDLSRQVSAVPDSVARKRENREKGDRPQVTAHQEKAAGSSEASGRPFALDERRYSAIVAVSLAGMRAAAFVMAFAGTAVDEFLDAPAAYGSV